MYYRQTYLCSSDQNKLAIGAFPGAIVTGRISHVAVKQTSLLTLPDELLTKILDLATLNNIQSLGEVCDCRKACDYATANALARTCHRLNRIVIPFLYENLEIGYRREVVAPDKATIRLYSTLRDNTSLRQHVRALSIFVHWVYFREGDLALSNAIISWLNNIRCLQLVGGFDVVDEDSEGFTLAVSDNIPYNIHQYERRRRRRITDWLHVDRALDHVDTPSPRYLEIQELIESDEGSLVSALKKPRTAPFTCLTIADWLGDAEELDQLLHWPIKLTSFTFSGHDSLGYVDLHVFHSALLAHKKTLKSLAIRSQTYFEGGDLFNAATFPELEILQLSKWQFHDPSRWQELRGMRDFSSTDADLLLAPQLKKFVWDFDINATWLPELSEFGEREEAWLREFARTVIARKAALQEIEIKFTPGVDEGFGFYSGRENGYPWDRMDMLHHEIRPFGITLRYNKPTLTKEAWLSLTSGGGSRDIKEFFRRIR